MSIQWEYHVVEVSTMSATLELELTALGSLGWEAVGITSADRVIGINSLHVLMKRVAHSYPPPAAPAASWHPDPSGRFQSRYWDGLRWTEHVTGDGRQEKDFPPLLPSRPACRRGSVTSRARRTASTAASVVPGGDVQAHRTR